MAVVACVPNKHDTTVSFAADFRMRIAVPPKPIVQYSMPNTEAPATSCKMEAVDGWVIGKGREP